MPDLPEEAVQAAVRAHECAWTAGASRKDLVRATLEAAAPVLAAQVWRETLRDVASLGERGLVVVSAEDLDVCLNWGTGPQPRTTADRFSAALARLRAALPEETTTDE